MSDDLSGLHEEIERLKMERDHVTLERDQAEMTRSFLALNLRSVMALCDERTRKLEAAEAHVSVLTRLVEHWREEGERYQVAANSQPANNELKMLDLVNAGRLRRCADELSAALVKPSESDTKTKI